MEVDVVYTWVNSRDENWRCLHRESLESYRGNLNYHESVNSPARFENRNEILYSIKSIEKYAPWIRKIYIVTNCSLPDELNTNSRVVRVGHEEIFSDISVLPTFNSRAIEANLHRIENLSESFIYFNDDVFLCAPVEPQDFFTDDDMPYVFPSKHDVPYGKKTGLRPVDYGVLNACAILEQEYGYIPKKKLHHAPFALKRSVLYELENRYSDILERTRSHQFRDKSDLPLATTMHAYYSVATFRATIKYVAARYVDIGDPKFLFLVHRFSSLRRGKYVFLCLNEVSEIKYFHRFRDWVVSRFMRKMFDEK